MTISTDEINRRAYTSGSAHARYSDRSKWHLFRAEEVVISRLLPDIANKEILDIGIGGGRTTSFLLSISPNYTGIDYSTALIESARRAFGINTLFACDVRDMHRFPDDKFDFALFSFNGIDSLCHASRLLALNEIRRVLKPGAWLLFATHNRDWKDLRKPPWLMPDRWTWAGIKSSAKALARLPRHLRMRRFEVCEPDYAVVNDGGFAYRILDYCISIESQIAQLRSLGFDDIEAFGIDAEPVECDRDNPFIHYLARKMKEPVREHQRAGGPTVVGLPPDGPPALSSPQFSRRAGRAMR